MSPAGSLPAGNPASRPGPGYPAAAGMSAILLYCVAAMLTPATSNDHAPSHTPSGRHGGTELETDEVAGAGNREGQRAALR